MTDQSQFAAPQPEKKKEGGGCFFVGCITLIILVAGIAIAGYFGFKFVANRIVNEYSQTAAEPVPTVQYTPAEASQVEQRVKTFAEAVKQNQPTSPLTLTGKDINMLVSTHPELSKLKDSIYVEIKNDIIGGQVSMPLEPFGYPGRYVNAAADFKVSLENGRMVITVARMRLKGVELPDVALRELQQRNLVTEFEKDPEFAKLTQKLESIEVKNGVLTLKARSGEAAPTPTVQ